MEQLLFTPHKTLLPPYYAALFSPLPKTSQQTEIEKASELLHNGCFTDAIQVAQQYLDQIHQQKGNLIENVYILILLGEAFTHTCQFLEAMQHLQEAKQIIEKSCSPLSSPLLTKYCEKIYYDIGYLLRLQNKNQESLDYFNKVFQIRSKEYGDKSLATSNSYNDMALIYTSMGQFDKSNEYLQTALQIRLEQLGNFHVDVATIYNNIANNYYYMGKFQDALEYFQRGQSILLTNQFDKHPDYATCLLNIAQSYKELKQFHYAYQYLKEALQCREMIFGSDHPFTATVYLQIGLLFMQNESTFLQSREYIVKCLQLKQNNNSTLQDIAQVYIYLGQWHWQMGQMETCVEYWKCAKEMYIQCLGKEHPDTLQCEELILYAHMVQNNVEQQNEDDILEQWMHIAQCKRKLFGNEHPTIATMYNNIGNVLRQQGRNQQALKMYYIAKSISEYAYGFDHQFTSIIYNNIGNIYFVCRQFAEALKWYIRSKSTRERIYGKEHVETILCYKNIGMVYLEMHSIDLALEYLQKAESFLNQLYSQPQSMMNVSNQFVEMELQQVRKLVAKILRNK